MGKKHYILKFGENEQCELPKTEYLSNQLARFLGIHVADHYLIRCERAGSRLAFVSNDFMQPYEGKAKLVHIFHYLEDPSDFNCEGLLRVLSRYIQETEKESAIKQFVRICLFDALIGNNDRHGRNIALIEIPMNGIKLAPFYDNPSYVGIVASNLLGAQLNPTGSIPTASDAEPTMTAYVEEFNRLGYEKLVNQFNRHFQTSKHQVNRIVKNSFLSPRRQNALLKLMEERAAALFRGAKFVHA